MGLVDGKGSCIQDPFYSGDVPGRPGRPIQLVGFLKAKSEGSKIKLMEEIHLKEEVEKRSG
jgi:hypothetical protein